MGLRSETRRLSLWERQADVGRTACSSEGAYTLPDEADLPASYRQAPAVLARPPHWPYSQNFCVSSPLPAVAKTSISSQTRSPPVRVAETRGAKREPSDNRRRSSVAYCALSSLLKLIAHGEGKYLCRTTCAIDRPGPDPAIFG